MSRLLDHLWYRPREGFAAKALLWPLWLLSRLFAWIVRRRLRQWERPGRACRVEARVVSVGNLVVGGAGKTPVTIHLARRLLAQGERPFVLSRGWGREHPSRIVVASDGRQILSNAREAGDEPLLIARACPGVPVIVGRDRAAAAQAAISEFGAKLFLLDDGLQHLRLARDLDVVVLDAGNPFGNGHFMPRGPLREPKQSLGRAGLVFLSKVEQATPDEVEALEAEIRQFTQAPIVRAAYRVADVLDDEGRSLGVRALAGKKVLLMAGIAQPASFRHTLGGLGAMIAGERLFADHHPFLPMEVEEVKLQARRQGVDAIALTEKDAVRLPDSAAKGPFAVVRIELDVRAGEEGLTAALEGDHSAAAATRR
ncbi:MAG: tetraacyldisaccharide 4'-kinase [Deltaproteobacteria bacterium]|nr:tetraacyldisaccharide 4'-kinase [Deltaproteobacteria bacterium]